MLKVIIAGGRNFHDYELLCLKCDKALSQQSEVEIVSGTAYGADKLGERYANERGYPIKRFFPDWGKEGRKAGFIRNEAMALYGDALIAFWNGESKGTKHMIDLAEKHGLKVKTIIYDENKIF